MKPCSSNAPRPHLLRALHPAHWLALLWMGVWAQVQAAESVQPEPLSRVEVKAMASKRSPAEMVLMVQGLGGPQQRLQLLQNNLVFYEQRLPEGEFKLNNIYPLDNQQTVNIKLITDELATEKADLPLRAQAKVTLFNQRFELAALAPLSRRVPLVEAGPIYDDIEFDGDFLRGQSFRNLTPADIRKLGTVRAGVYDADVYRNGVFITKTNLVFTEVPPGAVARACIPASLFNLLAVKPNYISARGMHVLQPVQAVKTNATPAANHSGQAAKSVTPSAAPGDATTPTCLHITDWVASSSEQFDVGELRYDIQIPQAFLSRSSRQSVPKELLTRGDNAAFVNYNFNSFKSASLNAHFLALNTGLNLGGWQFRQGSSVSQNELGQNQYLVGETVLKRPLIDQQANLVIGDTSTDSPVVGGVPLRGVRVSSEELLYPESEREYRPVVRGVARTNARVRVLQNNAVILEQNVPPGPFELPELNPISSVGNLQVVVSEADGSEQRFVVPFSISMGKLNPGSYRYSVATGLHRNFTSTQNTQVVQAYVRYGLSNLITPTIDVLAGPHYRNLGLQTSFMGTLGSVNFNTLFSHLFSTDGPKKGRAHGVNYLAPYWRNLSLYAGSNYQSPFYTTPTAGLGNVGVTNQVIFDTFKRSNFVSMGLGLDRFGTLSLGVVDQTAWGTAVATKQYQLGYGVNLNRVNLYANLSRTFYSDERPHLDTVNLSATIPLSLQRWNGILRASADQSGHNNPVTNSLSFYSGTSGALNDNFSYGLNTSHTDGVSSSGAYAAFQHPFGAVTGSYSTGGGTQQTGLSLSGGLVGHSGGLTLSPSLGETFGIVEVPQGQGASLLGSQAQVNGYGYAVVPYLSPYYLNDVQISLETAPMGLEIDNPTQKVAPVEGSIVKLSYKSTAGRPVAFTFSLPEDERIPIGASVFDQAGQELSSLGQGNRALVRLQADEGVLRVVWGDGAGMQCNAPYKLEKVKDANREFTRVKLRCFKPAPTQEARNQTGTPPTPKP
jgi:outer membrane usher protein